MDLRHLKKEVEALSNIETTTKSFQDNWIKTIRANSNSHLPFLNDIDPETKKELNNKLSESQDLLRSIRLNQEINEKLLHYARTLVELKLTTFNGDDNKSKILTNNLLNDNYLNLQTTINEIKKFNHKIELLNQLYEDINNLLHRNLSLEQSLHVMGMSHKKHIKELAHTAKKQKVLMQHLGKEFIDLTRKTRFKR